MAAVYVNGTCYQLSPQSVIGKGGEADIYDIGGRQVLKLYKKPDDPDYSGNPAAQTGARERLDEIQTKLPALIAAQLPAQVVAPLAVARLSTTGRRIAGYTMKYMRGSEVLLRLADRQYCLTGGIEGNRSLMVMRNLHDAVKSVHAAQMVIGDFNDLNVLFNSAGQVYLIDADSMQYGSFYCHTFTSRFVDPLACERQHLVLARPHNRSSDWYGFNVMLFQSLLFVDPYGGVHKPAAGKKLQHDGRVLKRLTVFSPEVLYPKPALPYTNLPDELLDYFQRVFCKDTREVFPENLLGSIRWTVCGSCRMAHARATCPNCATPGKVVLTITRRGCVTVSKTLATSGQILQTAVHQDQLRVLYFENGRFNRENGREVCVGPLDPKLRLRISGDNTLFGKENQVTVYPETSGSKFDTESIGHLPIFDANSAAWFWIQNGMLLRNGLHGSRFLGNVLPGKTLIWAGEKFGLGFYQAQQITRTFIFDCNSPNLNDNVAVPSVPGRLIDAYCVFSDRYAWLMISSHFQGQLINYCFVVSSDGSLVASTSSSAGQDDWLSESIRGRFAHGSTLFAATDEGLVRIGFSSGTLQVEQTFPDTEPFVNRSSQLLGCSKGIYVVSAREISLLSLK